MWHRTYVRFEALAGWLGEPSTRMVAGFSPRRSEMWDSQVVQRTAPRWVGCFGTSVLVLNSPEIRRERSVYGT
jgi:hypothetical protein